MPAKSWSRSPRVILGSLTTLNALNYLDRYVSAATLPLILTDLAISDAQGGLLQSLFIVAYALACGPAGWLGDAGKRLHLVAGGVFVWSVATVASGLAPTYGWLLIARAVIGIGEASYAVVTPSLLSDCYPAERRARVLGIFYAAIPIGSALGYIVGGLIGEAHGWRAAFFVAGAPGAALAFLLLFLTEPARGAQDRSHGAATPLGLTPWLRALASRRSYLVNTAAQIIYTFGMGGLATWMPTYFVRGRGLPLASAAATFGLLLVVAGFAGTLLGGRLSSAVVRRHPGADFIVSGWSLVVSIVFTLFAVLAPHPAVCGLLGVCLVLMLVAAFVTLSGWLSTDERRILLLAMVCVGLFVVVVARVLPAGLGGRVIAAPTAVMIVVCVGVVQRMAGARPR